MAQLQVTPIASTSRVIVASFVEGARIIKAPRLLRESADDALAHALWLARRGRSAEADEYLDNYIRRH